MPGSISTPRARRVGQLGHRNCASWWPSDRNSANARWMKADGWRSSSRRSARISAISSGAATTYLCFEKPRSFFAAMSFGNCGYAFPTIIGAKVAAPHRPAISYAGDGAWGMSLMETMTCVRHDTPVTAVVFHNRQWGAEKKNQVDFYNRRFVAGELDNQSFAGIAKAMDAEDIVVDKLEDVGPALKRAIDMQMNQGKTCIVEIMCTRELGDPFRRDALSKPVRLLDKYKDYV